MNKKKKKLKKPKKPKKPIYICCCYLDILGYKNMVNKFYKNTSLERNNIFNIVKQQICNISINLKKFLIENHKEIEYFRIIEETVTIEVVSDTIFIKMNLCKSDSNDKKKAQIMYFSFLVLMINMTFLTNYNASSKKKHSINSIALRGVIYCGLHMEYQIKEDFIKGSIIVSEALINSYLLESEVSKKCRIVVSSTFFDYFKEVIEQNDEIRNNIINLFIKDKEDEDFFLIFNTANIDILGKDLIDLLKDRYGSLVEQNKGNEKICEKYQYMLDLIEFNIVYKQNEPINKLLKEYSFFNKIKKKESNKFRKITAQDFKHIATKTEEEKIYLSNIQEISKKNEREKIYLEVLKEKELEENVQPPI